MRKWKLPYLGGVCKDDCKDPFLHSFLAKGKFKAREG